jgi:predicted CoA-binding protein
MNITLSLQQKIKSLLTEMQTIAVVGLSAKSNRPSHQVAAYLLAAGYHVIPVNPGHDSLLGRPCYPDLESIPVAVDVVDIFRRSADAGPIVEAAIRIKAKAVWMQLGVINEEAAAMAEKAGLIVIMDRCLQIDHFNFVAE